MVDIILIYRPNIAVHDQLCSCSMINTKKQQQKKTAEMNQTSILDRLVHKWKHGLLTKGTRLSADIIPKISANMIHH